MSLLSQLSGKEFYWSVLSGGKKIIENQEEINKINVFPVPDGDTGANLAATATSIIYNSKEDDCIKEVAASIGDAALDGARGNSGVIFAQFLYGIGNEIQQSSSISIKRFGEIVKKASEYVYSSIPSPKEGTIITVIREWATYIHTNKDKYTDFDTLLSNAYKVAKTALNKTTEQLEALKLAKVVDAGAKGFVLFLEGMYETITNKAFSRQDHDIEHLLMADYELPMAEAETLTEDSLHNRYCTETCIIGENISRDEVLAILEEDSDSIVIAGSDKKLRLHFHTNNPAEMFEKLLKFGSFSFQKVEDMRLQYNVTHKRKAPIALVVDTGVSLSPEFIDENQIHVVSAQVNINGVSYHDGRTITIDLFKKYTEDKTSSIQTSQVTPKIFADSFGYLSNYYESIIVLTMGSKVSGTYNSALQGKSLVQSKKDIKIDIIDSNSLSSGAGIVALDIVQKINDGVAHDEIVASTAQTIEKTNTYVNFKTIDHMIRSGRLGMFKGGIIKLLNLAPTLKMFDGKPTITGKAFGFKKALLKNILIAKEDAKGKKVKSFVVSHALLDNDMCQYLVDRLSRVFGCEPNIITTVHPCIAYHVGIGAISFAVTYE